MVDRWVMGGLMVMLSAVLWWLILDTRANEKATALIVTLDSSRITNNEARLDHLERTVWEINDELRRHRAFTEKP